MMSSYLLIFTIMVSSTQAVNVEFAYNSRGGPDLYLGDTLTLTCTSTEGVVITSMAFALNTPVQHWVNCGEGAYMNDPWTPSIKPVGNPFFSHFSSDCGTLGDPSGFTHTVYGAITEDFSSYIGSAFYCLSIENRADTTNSSTSLLIGDIKVSPENLTLTIRPDPVVEGEPFTLLCSSSSNSSSVYKYETSRDGGLTWSEITVSPPTYTPTSPDRGALLVRCTDTAHMTWTGGNTVQQTEVLPNYLEALIPSLLVLELNPTVDNSLTCDVSSRPEPVYSWTRTIGSETLESVRTVTFPRDQTRRDGESEEVVCTATVNGTSLSATTTWQITWDEAASTPATSIAATTTIIIITTTTTATQKLSFPAYAIAIIVVVVFLGGGGIVGFIYYRKKTNAENSENRMDMAAVEGRTTPAIGITSITATAKEL